MPEDRSKYLIRSAEIECGKLREEQALPCLAMPVIAPDLARRAPEKLHVAGILGDGPRKELDGALES